MPTSNADNNFGRLGGAEDRTGGPACEAQDLKRILTLLADQVADADRRHSDALAQLQSRLGQLGETAEGLKDQLPQHMMPVIDRIQGGMAALSDQIATTAVQRQPVPVPENEAAMFARPTQQMQSQHHYSMADDAMVPNEIEQSSRTQSAAPAYTQAYVSAPVQAAPMLSPPAVEAAPALRSALAADALDAFARRAQSARTGSNSGVDHFDVVDSDAPRAEQSWDAIAAEALASHYGSPASHPTATDTEIARAIAEEQSAPQPTPENPQRTTPAAPVLGFQSVAPSAYVPGLSPPPVVAAPSLSTADFAAEVVSLQSKAFEGERRWLEDRFGDIAVRLETSLRDIDPAGPIGSIDLRFSQLEKKLTDALAGNAKTTDLAGLQHIESQVEDLTAQLVTVQSHFSRLDNIELELRSLADGLSPGNLSKLMALNATSAPDSDELASAVADRIMQEMPRFEDKLERLADRFSDDRISALVAHAQPGAADANAIARVVAEQVGKSLPLSLTEPGAAAIDPSPQLEELREMLELFANEQRHGGEQTTSMLDTMQQAMIRLLDRMDAIEQIAQASPVEIEREPARPQVADLHANDLHGREMPELQHEGQRGAALPASLQSLRAPQPAPQPQNQPPAAQTVQQPVQPQIQREAATQRAGLAQPAPPMVAAGPASPVNSREDLVAAARRASRIASESSNDPDADDNDKLAQKSRRPGDTAIPAAAAKPRRQMSKVSMALLCLVAVGASFAIVKSTILAPGQAPRANAPAPVQQAAPKKAPEKGGLQNLEDADVIIEEERRTGVQRRSSLPDQSVPGQPVSSQSGGNAERDVATAFEGGPGAAVPVSQLQNYGGFTPAMSEFARQNIPYATQTALTKDKPAGAAGAKPNEALPLTIGPNSLRAAAVKGDPSAEFEIGARYAEGRGVPQDLEQAIAWYQKAASQGFGPAQYRLGSMYERGLGVKADMARARVWYQRAAEQGIVKAMHNLAVLTAGRDNSATDYDTAAKWFKAASEYGLTDSQFNLAIMLDSGLGVPRDAKQAYRYFSLAARSGDDEAARRRETLRSKLPPQEAAEVDAELQKWRPRSADQAMNDPRMAGEGWKSRAR